MLHQLNQEHLPWGNFTEGALHMFFEESGISEQAMSSLLAILHHKEFKVHDVPSSVYKIKVRAKRTTCRQKLMKNFFNQQEISSIASSFISFI